MRLAPKAIALPSPRQLREANDEVFRLNKELDRRVEERTADLAEAERHYRQLFEFNPLPMWVREPEGGQFLAVNPAAIELYGYSEQEFLSMSLHQLAADGESGWREIEDSGKPHLQRHVRQTFDPIGPIRVERVARRAVAGQIDRDHSML